MALTDDDKQWIKGELITFGTTFSAQLKDYVDERTRDMQTEMLRGFHSFANGQGIRLRKLEADHSNLDAAHG